MPDKSASPFAGLDRALLRSTQLQPAPSAEPKPDEPPLSRVAATKPAPSRRAKDTAKPKSERDSNTDSTLASYHDSVIETIRKIVKSPGREVSFTRLTSTEKQQVADIVYSYKKRGRKTSENEINRIAVNFILQDYQTSGEASILARVLDALIA